MLGTSYCRVWEASVGDAVSDVDPWQVLGRVPAGLPGDIVRGRAMEAPWSALIDLMESYKRGMLASRAY